MTEKYYCEVKVLDVEEILTGNIRKLEVYFDNEEAGLRVKVPGTVFFVNDEFRKEFGMRAKLAIGFIEGDVFVYKSGNRILKVVIV